MENIKSRLPEINKKYDIHYTNKTSGHHAQTTDQTTYFVGDSIWKTIIHILPKNYVWFYNDEICEKVKILYGNDLTNFNYTWIEFIKC